MFRCPKCRYHPKVRRDAPGGETPMWPSCGAGTTWTLTGCPECKALFASPAMGGFVPDEVKKDPEITICEFKDLVLPEWIALVYGNWYGNPGAGPRVVHLDADSAEECWKLLRDREIAGENLDVIRLECIAKDTRVRLFKVEEHNFKFLETYVKNRSAREKEEEKRTVVEVEEKTLRDLAARHGYSLVKP